MDLRTKKCPSCKTLRFPTQFIYKNKEHKTCDNCAEQRKKSYEKYKEKSQQSSKNWKKNNQDKVKEHRHKYYKNNTEKCIDVSKEYYKNNTEKCLEDSKEYYKNNTEKCIEYSKEWYINNTEKCIEYSKESYDKNKQNEPLKVKFQYMIYNSKNKDTFKNRPFTIEEYIDMDFLTELFMSNNNCFYCNCILSLDFDRNNYNRISIQRHDNSIAHIKSNCCFSCISCNCIKHREHIDNYEQLETIHIEPIF